VVKVKSGAKVITIERAQNVLTVERVVELFSAAFGHVCVLKVLNSFGNVLYAIRQTVYSDVV
jgi:ribosomal protein L19